MTNQTASEATFDVVSVKGFGDLVITLTCLIALAPDVQRRFRLLIGHHLKPLFDALDPPFEADVLPHHDNGPAALFQVQTRKPMDIMRSALGLRKALRHAHDRSSVLLFDEIDVRHRFLALGMNARTLPKSDNLYKSWNALLSSEGLVASSSCVPRNPQGRRVHIFPGAREKERQFPPALLADIVSRAMAMGLEPRVFTVAGEMPHLEGYGLPLEQIPRDFGRTRDTVRDADRIISADSMTGHLAEYHSVPVYILWPREKLFWLPLSAAVAGRHALFSDNLDSTTLAAFLA